SIPLTGTSISTVDNDFATGSYALVTGHLGSADGVNNTIKYNNSGVFFYKSNIRESDVSDGLSHTLFAGEAINGHLRESRNLWSRSCRSITVHRSTSNPLNSPAWVEGTTVPSSYKAWEPQHGSDPLRYSGAFISLHPGGANFTFGDGHVEFISENIAEIPYKALSTRSGNENIAEY
ncbi:MAG: DUF1559 domain-containing protein, partial [Planctomycetia bacterium]